ncbi:MAG: hypothetical protein ACRC7O_04535 [Fimbriiglobus sp.]
MTTFTIVLALLRVLSRVQSVFPFLRRGTAEIEAALKSQTAVPVAFGAAPAEVKDAILAVLNGLTVSGVFAKIALRFLIQIVPRITDDLWDRVFVEAKAPTPVTVANAAATFETECERCLCDCVESVK